MRAFVFRCVRALHSGDVQTISHKCLGGVGRAAKDQRRQAGPRCGPAAPSYAAQAGRRPPRKRWARPTPPQDLARTAGNPTGTPRRAEAERDGWRLGGAARGRGRAATHAVRGGCPAAAPVPCGVCRREPSTRCSQVPCHGSQGYHAASWHHPLPGGLHVVGGMSNHTRMQDATRIIGGASASSTLDPPPPPVFATRATRVSPAVVHLVARSASPALAPQWEGWCLTVPPAPHRPLWGAPGRHQIVQLRGAVAPRPFICRGSCVHPSIKLWRARRGQENSQTAPGCRDPPPHQRGVYDRPVVCRYHCIQGSGRAWGAAVICWRETRTRPASPPQGSSARQPRLRVQQACRWDRPGEPGPAVPGPARAPHRVAWSGPP
jgi:hypothetical protein